MLEKKKRTLDVGAGGDSDHLFDEPLNFFIARPTSLEL